MATKRIGTMEMVRELATAVQASYQTPVGSLRHFARFGAVAIGVISGIAVGSKRLSSKEAVLHAAIAERDAQIATLSAQKAQLESSIAGEIGKVSSGDPVQDWIDSLSQ